jgi:endogenous inhibitor of DNA gyrase (YacG/DUF329 family)
MLCPICQTPSVPALTPFCSKLCKNMDLLRWFQEDYRIPTQDPLIIDDEIDREES